MSSDQLNRLQDIQAIRDATEDFESEADQFSLPPEQAAKNAKERFQLKISNLQDCIKCAKYGVLSTILTVATLASLVSLGILGISASIATCLYLQIGYSCYREWCKAGSECQKLLTRNSAIPLPT